MDTLPQVHQLPNTQDTTENQGSNAQNTEGQSQEPDTQPKQTQENSSMQQPTTSTCQASQTPRNEAQVVNTMEWDPQVVSTENLTGNDALAQVAESQQLSEALPTECSSYPLAQATTISAGETYRYNELSLDAYGFFVDLPHRHRKEACKRVNNFIKQHLILLNTECNDEHTLFLQMSDNSGSGTLFHSICKRAAQSLNRAAVAVAMRMELNKEECIKMVPQILSDSNFSDIRLFLVATHTLKMDWFRRAILEKISINDPRADFYVLLSKFGSYVDRSQCLKDKVKKILATGYGKIHKEFTTFCLEARDNCTTSTIAGVQREFNIITPDNIAYFMNEELLFVVTELVYYGTLSIDESKLTDGQIRLLLQSDVEDIVGKISLPRIEAVIRKMIKYEYGKAQANERIGIQPAFNLPLMMALNLVEMIDTDGRILPTITRELTNTAITPYFFYKDASDDEVRSLLDSKPECITKEVIIWLAHTNKISTLRVFFEKMREMKGVKMEFDEETTELVLFKHQCYLKDLKGTGIQLKLRMNALGFLTTNIFSRHLQKFMDQVHIPKYNLRMVKYLIAYKKDYLLEPLRESIRDKDLFDRFVEWKRTKGRE
jgi:hypothetical protein